MISREEDGAWVTMEEKIAVHHEQVFGCLTSAVGLTRWLCVSARVDLRQGGLIVFGWDEAMAHTSTVAILDYDAGGRIVWDWYTVRGETHAPLYWTVTPEVETGARVVLRQGPFPHTVEGLEVLAEEVQMWRWYLCNLRTALEANIDMRRIRPL